MRTADMLKELYGEFGNVAEQYRTGNRYEVTDLTRAGIIISVIMNQMKVGKRAVEEIRMFLSNKHVDYTNYLSKGDVFTKSQVSHGIEETVSVTNFIPWLAKNGKVIA